MAAADDSMSDDVFETSDDYLDPQSGGGDPPRREPSPTGYPGYQPPATILPHVEQIDVIHKVIITSNHFCRLYFLIHPQNGLIDHLITSKAEYCLDFLLKKDTCSDNR